jgi:putative membrane protein
VSGTPSVSVDDVAWRRLSVRVVWINVVRLLLSLIPGYLGIVVLNDTGPVTPLVIASAIGVLGAVVDFRRWMTTRYRVTAERIEMRTGWLVRKDRFVPRDRIRSVDSSAKARHRLAAVRVVHIGSGEASSSFTLDALSADATERLQRELMTGSYRPSPDRVGDTTAAPVDTTAAPVDAATAPAATAPDDAVARTVIARFRWRWVWYNSVSVLAPLMVIGPLFGAYWSLRPFGIDLLRLAGNLADWREVGLGWAVAGGLAVTFPLGILGLAVAFVMENWKFELVRTGTPPHTTLLTRRGLVNTSTVHRDDQRLRGLNVREPLLWRWWGLADTRVITTGLRQAGGSEPGSAILPRIKLDEARAVARRVLPDGPAPMAADLHRHPRGALTRRLLQAVYAPGVACLLLAWLGATDAIPDGVWPIPLALLPVTLSLAVVGYRALGHALVGPYLVVRGGAVSRSTVALERRAIIGWKVEQSLFQRWGGRMTVGVATAAGERFYRASDVGVDQALALISGATPALGDTFLTGPVLTDR